MSDKSGFYSVVQFSARPSSFEYVNAGVVIVLPQVRQMRVLMSDHAHRVKKLFDDQNAHDFNLMAASFRNRLELEFQEAPSLERLTAFAGSRANLFRLLPFLPIAVEDIDADARRLFAELVGDEPQARRKSAQRKLADLFKAQGLLDLVDRKPEPVALPGLQQPLRADYGYQNGRYNLIEAVRISPRQELNAVSRIAGQAQLLKAHSDKRLIVVADLPPNAGLLDVIAHSLADAEARVFPLSDSRPLFEDIRAQAARHDRSRLIP